MRYLYLHGFASSPGSKKAQYFVSRFAEKGLLLEVPRLDGGDFTNLTVTSQMNLVEELVAGQPVILMGSSMGGYLAALYASRHPEVEKLILMAPAFYFPQRWADTMDRDKADAWRTTGSMMVYHYTDGLERSINYSLVEDAQNYPGAPNFTQPAILFHGLRDTVVPYSFSEEFAASHPNAQLRLLESDHQLTDQTEQIWTEIDSYLK